MAIPRAKTELEIYLENGIDEKNRRLFFGKPLSLGDEDGDEIDATDFSPISVQLAVRAIKRMASDHPTKPIEIHVCSAGGDPEHMMYLVDTMLSTGIQFKFYGGGRISSSATWLMAISDERWLHQGTQVMVHSGTAPKKDDTVNGEVDVEQNKKYQKFLEKVYEENSRMPKEFWSDICKRDCWMSAEEAITLGLADKIIPHKKRGTLRKMRQACLNKKIDKRKLRKLVDSLYDRIQAKSNIKELNLHVPKEEIDESLTIDNTPVQDEILSEEIKKE